MNDIGICTAGDKIRSADATITASLSTISIVFVSCSQRIQHNDIIHFRSDRIFNTYLALNQSHKCHKVFYRRHCHIYFFCYTFKSCLFNKQSVLPYENIDLW